MAKPRPQAIYREESPEGKHLRTTFDESLWLEWQSIPGTDSVFVKGVIEWT